MLPATVQGLRRGPPPPGLLFLSLKGGEGSRGGMRSDVFEGGVVAVV